MHNRTCFVCVYVKLSAGSVKDLQRPHRPAHWCHAQACRLTFSSSHEQKHGCAQSPFLTYTQSCRRNYPEWLRKDWRSAGSAKSHRRCSSPSDTVIQITRTQRKQLLLTVEQGIISLLVQGSKLNKHNFVALIYKKCLQSHIGVSNKY